MADPASLVSEAFQAFMREAPEQAQAWSAMVGGLAEASGLDKKTSALAYLAVLAAGLGVTQVLPAAIAAYDAA